MRVCKRNGEYQNVEFDKITTRLQHLAYELVLDVSVIAQYMCSAIYDGIKTSELDIIASNYCASKTIDHPDYGVLASRIAIDNNHKTTKNFKETVDILYHNCDKKGKSQPLISKPIYELMQMHGDEIEAVIDYNRDFAIDYFGFKTLEKNYLARMKGQVIERPQHMWMRVALGLHGPNLEKVFETYNLMSNRYFTHATPTLFNCGSGMGSLSSCYILGMDDSIEGMYDCLKSCALISKWAGGIGIHASNIRANGSLIRGTNGSSSGILPMIRVFNNTARHVNQCFTPNTLIYTENGVKRIEDIEPGTDFVLTNDGTFKKVMQIFSRSFDSNHENEQMYEIACWNSFEPIQVTRQHQMYVLSGLDANIPMQQLEKMLQEGKVVPDYVAVEDLSVNDIVCYPVPSESCTFLDDVEDKHSKKWRMLVLRHKLMQYDADGNEIAMKDWEYSFIYNGYVYGKIRYINPIDSYKGVVYDLNVQDNHNYVVASFGLVHNSGRRLGSICIYLEPHHADIVEFLHAKRNVGNEEERARDLFYALWVSDLFMERVEKNQLWSLMCPDDCPGLNEVYGEEYKQLYLKYEQEGNYVKQVQARQIWDLIIESQIESGTPYMCYKDAVNFKSNQKNIGTIKSSNLCAEINEYNDSKDHANCNLASIALPTFLKDGKFDFEQFEKVVRVVVYNLNTVININRYPTPETKATNLSQRPIGIGVQGLADLFVMLRLPYDSFEAREWNEKIFEHLYYYALKASCDFVDTFGVYEYFKGSPASHGQLQFDLWKCEPKFIELEKWNCLKQQIQNKGMCNSLLIALMPTASTSQILGYNSCFEPFVNNLFQRRTLAGEFTIINKYLMQDLIDLKLWNDDMKQQLLYYNGSIQAIDNIPDELKKLYKTAYELKQKSLIDLAVDRAKYVCQSQSMNLFITDPNYNTLTSIHFYTWKRGLKTGSYYIRTKPVLNAQKFGMDIIKEQQLQQKEKEQQKKRVVECTDDVCIVCSA